MKIEQLEKWVHAQGSVSNAAKKLGLSRQAVYCYLWGTRIPSDKVIDKIKKLSRKK